MVGGTENNRGAVARRGDLTFFGNCRHGSSSEPNDSDEPKLDFAIAGRDRRAWPRPAAKSCRVVKGPPGVWGSVSPCFRNYFKER